MKIVRETAEVFDSVTRVHKVPKKPRKDAFRKELEALWTNEVIRVINHPHKTNKTGACLLLGRVFYIGRRANNRKFACKHDGKDLLVKRLW